ncbi:MAG: hypothetical protein ACKVWR_14020 [Acidimicrobiales bacterium]
MIRRLVWMALGAGGAVWVERRVKRLTARIRPDHAAVRAGRRVAGALGDGRAAARHAEARLRSEYRPG